MTLETRVYEQIHIDVARNATDDFNPFHDGGKWQRIAGNPFGGAIVLGFQLECLAEYEVSRKRHGANPEHRSGVGYHNYQFTFADVLRPGEPFEIDVKGAVRGKSAAGDRITTNRVILRRGGGLVLAGAVRESAQPLCPVDADLITALPRDRATLAGLADRHAIAGTNWFHKRKYAMNSNAKNLISGSLADQAWYFDELEDRIDFPDLVPASFISCALLERALAAGMDFYANPRVYTSHHISVAQAPARALRANDRLHILVDDGRPVPAVTGLGGRDIDQERYQCVGLLADGEVLFLAEVMMASLSAIRQ